jgi:hypothetical protein
MRRICLTALLRAGMLILPAVLLPTPARAQTSAVAQSYGAYYAELREARPQEDQSADVIGLTLHRDGADFILEEGRIWLFSPVNGRTVGLGFVGKGIFRYTPATVMEQERLQEVKKVSAMDERFSELVILFGDSTLEELSGKLNFRPTEKNDGLRSRYREMLSYLGKDDKRSFDPDVIVSLLNGERTDLFYAHMARGGDPWIYMINPHEVEGIRLMGRPRGVGWVRFAEVVTQTRRAGEDAYALSDERTPEAAIRHYNIESWMTQNVTGGLNFSAVAKVQITSDRGAGPWVAFQLYDELEVDSATTESGQRLDVFKAKDHYAVFLRMDGKLAPGESKSVILYYHGDVVDAFGEWFFVKSSVAWYPVSMEGRAKATFDLTFHHPRSLTLASVGERTDSSLAGTIETSRWVTRTPIRNASFNLGIFDATEVNEDGVTPITLLSSEKGHRELYGGGGSSFGGITRRVSADIVAAMKFFTSVFGPLPINRFYATEIPAGHGEAFPGMINLSYVTFAPNRDDGFDEFFRGHEVAHQWWGIGVDYATYHDRWISEGFSSFCGLWFLQTRRGDNKRYFDQLERYRADIMVRRNDALPVWLGHRVATARTGDDYSAIVYDKGAWVLHMLRMLTLDLQTMKEDRFSAIMREFYQTYAGGRASTEDFRRIVEKHVGTDMRWFFDQWIYRFAIPTYRVAWRSVAQADGSQRVRLRVRQENVSPDFMMYVPVTVDLGNNRLARARVRITGASSEIDFPVPLPSAPKAVRFNDMEGVLAEVKTEVW